ncbi:hypothetical protein EJ110_NYTH20336 [Nymphaea thermarum]|nr:hypothetical protein EJ110_NYTH20336 [Nymphaea thermarum]
MAALSFTNPTFHSHVGHHRALSGTASCGRAPLLPCEGGRGVQLKQSGSFYGRHAHLHPTVRSSSGDIIGSDGYGEPISLGTMKLPSDVDLQRFERLLFQWANSLCQGANLPLPVPLKIDKVQGGVRLGFISIRDGKTEECTYIDCLVFPATDDSGPVFRALRNGAFKEQAPPGEPRIMKSLLAALQKSVEIARIQG